jgi:V8-like Glu-specific endopeptidase
VFIETEGWTGTGFLVAKDLVMTSHHVVPDRSVLSKVSVRFNYQLTVDGHDAAFERAAPADNGLFHADAATDHALFQLAGAPGDKWGFAPLSARQPVRNQRVNIIQHPAGMPKQISVQDNRVMFADPQVLQYVTATLNGSSGSPVFDDNWNVVGVHHAGGLLTEPASGMRVFRNEGIAIPAVLCAMPADVQQKLPPVAGWNVT